MGENTSWTHREPYEMSDIDFKYVMNYYEWSRMPKDYGTGEKYTLSEVHSVTFIEENPGVTITFMSEQLGRTKSAISQVIKRLEKLELIYKLDSKEDKKKTHLFVTPKGRELSLAHKAFDVEHVNIAIEDMKKTFTESEIDTFYSILEQRIQFMFKSLTDAKDGKPVPQNGVKK